MTCELKAIVAVCDDWGIGRDGDMVVSNRADMRHFVNKTKGHPVIMGRKTLESLAIVAVCDDWGIGRDGDMVVSNRADMRHFVNKTKGHPVIMGRKTLESFPGGRPLKDRRNIVLTRDEAFSREGVEVVHSVDEALAAVADEDVAWVIGGGAVYGQFRSFIRSTRRLPRLRMRTLPGLSAGERCMGSSCRIVPRPRSPIIM